MRTLSYEKFIAYLALFSGLSLSAVAAYYSVAGLMVIFAAAAVPVMIMGAVLELSKLVATVWLKQNWEISPFSMKAYLLVAILVFMLITSMGIFGFLSKGHSDQAVPAGEVSAQISIVNDKISTLRENIEAAKQQLAQLDSSVNQTLSRSSNVQGANKAEFMRRAQIKERAELKLEIQRNQQEIAKLTEEKRPLENSLRSIEAEVGPIKYLAAFIYGDTNPEVLEKAVTWMIILIITVFDPVAVLLLLASQISFASIRTRESQPSKENSQPLQLDDKICHACGEGTLTEVVEQTPVQVNGKSQYVNLHYSVCNHCGSQLTNHEQSLRNIEEYARAFDTDKESETTQPIDRPEDTAEPIRSTSKKRGRRPGAVTRAVSDLEKAEQEKFEKKLLEKVSAIPEPHKWTDGIDNSPIDWSKVPSDQEYIQVGDQLMSVRAAKSLYPPKKSK